MRVRYLGLLLVAMFVSIAGCHRAQPGSKAPPPDFRRFAELPGLTKSPDSGLQNELARLKSEEATPAQLAAQDRFLTHEELTALLEDLPLQRVGSLQDDIEKIYPSGPFVFSTAAAIRAQSLLKNEEKLIGAAIGKVAYPEFVFPVDHAQGLLADFTLIDVAALAHRGLALQATGAIDGGDLDKATSLAVQMLTLDHALARTKHVIPRIKAVTLRLEALRVLEAIVQHTEATPQLHARLRDLLALHLQEWPPDADAWTGDRAQGLHTYEMIRHGLVLSILTDKELEELSEEAGITATAKAIAQDVDVDEAFYLETMRDVIAACDKPYHQRRKLLKNIELNLQDRRADPKFPLIAGRVLLVDLDTGHLRQAKDRAACEGWLMALSLALGDDVPPFTHNPETGKAYEWEREGTRILVRNARAGEADEAIVVPVLK